MKKFQTIAATAVLAAALGAAGLAAANKYGTPKTIIHVVTILWKADSTPEQQQAALDGVKKMAAEIPGIKNVWIRGTKVQGTGPRGKDGSPGRSYQSAFVIEFEDQAAAERYAEHPAHEAWGKIYLPVREQSTSHQVTN
ncbi:MAG: Dabb family protein [Acidobacteria bacterium]|nr:Dabb family protein [Acidobacteriota bacterium]